MGIGTNKFKSNSEEYSTPQVLFDYMNNIYKFDLDVCASKINHKCKNYYTKEQNSLTKDWIGNCWMNPPFNKNLKDFVLKAHDESIKNNGIKCCLIPVRSNTNWWGKVINDAEIIFIIGEVNFNNEKRGLWLPMCFLIFGNNNKGKHNIINYRNMRKNNFKYGLFE